MTGARLSQRQKAAVIVRLLLDDDEASGLARLDSDSQTLVAEEMARMELVDRDTRDAVITEFCDRLESVGVTFPGNLDGTLAMLGARLSEDSVDRLRRLSAMPITRPLLESTRIGVTVGHLRKREGPVAALADGHAHLRARQRAVPPRAEEKQRAPHCTAPLRRRPRRRRRREEPMQRDEEIGRREEGGVAAGDARDLRRRRRRLGAVDVAQACRAKGGLESV